MPTSIGGGRGQGAGGGASPRTDHVLFQQFDDLTFDNNYSTKILFDQTQTVGYDTSGISAIPSWAALVVPDVNPGDHRTDSGKQLTLTQPGVYLYKAYLLLNTLGTDADTTGLRSLSVGEQDYGAAQVTASTLGPDAINDILNPLTNTGWLIVPTADEVPYFVSPSLYQNSGGALTANSFEFEIQKII